MVRACRDGYCGAPTCPAFWYNGVIWLGDGCVTDDTVGHEFAHGVIFSDSNLHYQATEAGAINESLADMWGEWIDQANEESRDGDTIVGTESSPWDLFEDDQCLAAPPLRSMSNPHLKGHPELLYEPGYWHFNQMDQYDFTHKNNGVGNKLCYLLCQSASIGPQRTQELVYESLSSLNTSTTYYNLCEVLIDDAATLGFSAGEIGKLTEACRTVEIYKTLMGRWNLDEGSGATAADSTAYGRDCTFSGDPEWVNGVSGYALDLDGDDYASRDALPALCGGAVTISAWIKASPSLSDSASYAIAAQSVHDSGYKGYWLGISSTDRKPAFWVGSSGVSATTSLTPGRWYHIAGSYDGVNLRVFVNGLQENYSPVQAQRGYVAEFRIGSAADGSNGFIGIIDDVQVYNYACSGDEVQTIMFEGPSKQFWVKDASDAAVACIDSLGNLFTKGTVTQSGTPQASANDDEFRVQNPNAQDVAIINAATGNMVIAGTVYENQTNLSGASNLIIGNSQNNTVAYIDTSGNLYLQGELYEQWLP